MWHGGPVIEVAGLTFSYPASATPALRGLEFDIAQGEIFGFLGPNGAGKSTTQKILIKLLREYGGAARVLGHDLVDWGPDYFERVGVSFELPNHYLKLSARENLRYFSALYRGTVHPPERLLEQVGLGSDADILVGQYSKGMKNRLSIARALLNDPELIFLDEPTAGLDPISARNIKELIRRQRELGKTVFLTTHDMTVADELCDRVAFIVDGQIENIDAPRNLKLRYGTPAVRVEYLLDGRTAVREFPLKQLGTNTEFAELLQGEAVQTIHTQEATLEEIFIEITGRGLA